MAEVIFARMLEKRPPPAIISMKLTATSRSGESVLWRKGI